MEDKKLHCGLIMPISAMDGRSAEHWVEVREIITEAIKSITDYTFDVNIVSASDDIGVIQKRIVQNIYTNDIIICDVSAKNPNVMLELGMRLAFDKATIIIKDSDTSYNFDTSPIEHLEYPRDLRFSNIVNFKDLLAKKTIATYEKSIEDPEYSVFLKSFGDFQVPTLSEENVPADQYILDTLQMIQADLNAIKRKSMLNSQLSANQAQMLEKETGRFRDEEELHHYIKAMLRKDRSEEVIKKQAHLRYGASPERTAKILEAITNLDPEFHKPK